ncbi:hypothetical protein ABK040_015976 [Willaertia magna]
MMIASSSLDNHVHNVIKQRSDRKISYENNNSSNNNNFTERISSFSSTKRKKRNNCCFCRTITNYSSQSSSEITKMSFFEYLFSFITIINVLLLLFILQGLFGLSSSFILLYTTGDSVLENTRQFQQFQVQLFINHQLTDFIETTSLMAEHLKYQLRYLPLNLRDDISWIRLFQYYFNIYSYPVSSVYFSKRNDEFIMLTKEEDNSYSLKINNATNYLVWRKLNLTEQIGDDYFETREIFQRDNIPFFPTSRTWFKFYFEKNNTFPRWADLFINFRGELAFTLTMPVYVNETVTNNTFIESPIYEDKSNPGPTSLYGIIGIQISLKIINDFLNRTFSGDLDFVMIINSKSDVIAVSSQHARNDSGLVEGLALKEIKELDLLTWIVHPHANNNDNAISIGNGTHFVLSGDSFGVIDVQFTVITDNYGLDWAVVIGVPTKSFGDEIFGGSGVISLVVFIIVFILGMTILFIIVKVISIPLQRIYKRMVDLVRFKGIRKHENNRLSIFYDVRNMQRSIKAMKRGIKTFSRYVPEIIVKHSMNSKEDSEYGKIGMALRHMSVMFSDITDFTLLVEKTDTTTFLTIMTEYFSGMCQVIENHQGLVDKFIGDAVMGFFNERSFPIVNHEIQACHAALDSFNVLQELNSKWKLCGYPEIDIHIVINSGNMLCGNIGAENRMNFTVVGYTVNIASRLEVLNKTFNERILISKDTYEKVKDKFICYFVDYVVLKGNDKGIAIYSVICDIKDATELQIELCKSLEMICKLLISFEFKKMTEMCKTLYEKSNCKIVEHLLNRSISLQHLKETLPEITMKDIAFSLKNEE